MFRGQQEAGGRGWARAAALSVVLAAVAFVVPSALPGGAASPAVAATADETASSGAAAGPGTEGTGSDPVRIAVPYTGQAELGIGDGWAVSDCGRVNVPTGVAMQCSADSVTLTSKGYRTDFGTVPMTVPMHSGSVDLDVTYLVSLAAPVAPALEKQTYDYPFEAGTTASIPYADLHVRCDGCAAGPRVRVVSAKPAGVVATVTPTGLLVRGPADWTGTASVRLRATDDQGGSGSATVRAVFVAPGPSGLQASDVVRRLGSDGTLRVDLRTLASARKGTVVVSGCGDAVSGTVSCDDDGTATFRPSGTMTRADQFAFHVRTAAGDQATGTVTVLPRTGARTAATALGTVPTDDATGVRYPAPGLQTADGTRSARSVVATLPSEDDAAGDDATGLLTPLTEPLDRITESSR
ncbi:Ig-like domain-containing protein [Curtobacterium pusillum]|uniref:Ig-like domain-containing protein n=1 Tax=Curtobacterium pusillum TaxID=69373 RepID=UPI0011A77875|nr:hypothetical protein [Curtobacterium pusillum]